MEKRKRQKTVFAILMSVAVAMVVADGLKNGWIDALQGVMVVFGVFAVLCIAVFLAWYAEHD
jgi:ABC-type proline/glycine betaine transport system permease subunit